jgi:hypothetical protein
MGRLDLFVCVPRWYELRGEATYMAALEGPVGCVLVCIMESGVLGIVGMGWQRSLGFTGHPVCERQTAYASKGSNVEIIHFLAELSHTQSEFVQSPGKGQSYMND